MLRVLAWRGVLTGAVVAGGWLGPMGLGAAAGAEGPALPPAPPVGYGGVASPAAATTRPAAAPSGPVAGLDAAVAADAPVDEFAAVATAGLDEPAEATSPVGPPATEAAYAPEGAAAKPGPSAAALKKQREALQKAVQGAYAPLFYNNNFDYLNNPLYDDWHLGESFKRLPMPGTGMLDVGGQYRARQQSERNFRGLGLTGLDDDFLLHRTRLFANYRVADGLRVYAEYIDAESNYETFPFRGIEVNRSDMLNGFVDLRLADVDRGELWFRGGRQELLFGNQRLVSPLDWANTRRTFDGVSVLWKGEAWDAHGFYTRPVLVDPHNFDSPTYDEEFMGVYTTYHARKDRTLDIFYLRYNNGRGLNAFKFDTLGTRWFATGTDGWMWEWEGGVQFGENTGGTDHGAGYFTVGLGRKVEQASWKPTVWAYYDYASGGNLLGARRGFDHLFPLAHKYLGFMDLFARSNIQSPNVQVTVQPHKKLQALLWWHYLRLEDTSDTPYTVAMTPVNPANAPASADLGHELDVLFTLTLTPRSDLLFGYSHFFPGNYYRLTPGLPYRGDADFFYTQYTINF